MLTNIWLGISILLLQPVCEGNFVLVNESSALLPGLFIKDQHLSGVPVLSKQYATLLKKLPNRSTSVSRRVLMHGMLFSWWEWPILARKVSAREHMSRCKGARCLDTVKKKNLILWRHQNHTVSLVSKTVDVGIEIWPTSSCRVKHPEAPAICGQGVKSTHALTHLELGRGTAGAFFFSPSLFSRVILADWAAGAGVGFDEARVLRVGKTPKRAMRSDDRFSRAVGFEGCRLANPDTNKRRQRRSDRIADIAQNCLTTRGYRLGQDPRA